MDEAPENFGTPSNDEPRDRRLLENARGWQQLAEQRKLENTELAERLARLEERFDASPPTADTEREPEPMIDLNRPKRNIAPTQPTPRTPDERRALARQRLLDASPAYFDALHEDGIL